MKKNLGKFIALSLLTASVFSFGQCKIGQCEAIKSVSNDNGRYNLVGTAENHGDFARNSEFNYSGWINYPALSKTNYDNVNVTMNFDYTKPGIAYDGDKANQITSASALDVIFENTKIVCHGDIRVVNESKLNPLLNLLNPLYGTTANGIYAKDGGEIDFSNAKSVYIASYKNVKKGDAISAKKGGKVSISTNKVNGFTKIIGNVDFVDKSLQANGTINMELNNSRSFWYGDENNDYWNNGIFNFMIENGGEWIYNLEPKLSNVDLNQGGIINLKDSDIKTKFETLGSEYYSPNNPHKYVIVHNLHNENGDNGEGGIFKVDLQYNDYSKSPVYLPLFDNPNVGESSDYIFVKQGSGTYDVQFDKDASKLDEMQNGDKLYFANDKSGGVTFKSSTVEELAPKTSAANLYDYKYAVKNEANGNAKDWFIALDQGDANENIPAAFKAMQAGYALGTEMDRFNKRMGESRYLEGDSGLWVRYRHARTGWENSFKTNSNMFQVGFDKLKLEKDGKHYRGGAVDYTDANTSLLGLKGNGEHERYALSLYDTWIGDKGHYLDLVLRGGRTSNDLDVTTRNQEIIKGKYHQNFGSISGEWGRKLANDNGWYVEPQAQLQIARVGSADYRTNYGVKVEQDAATSVIARAGFRLGRDFSDKGNFYMKADWLHEFCGDQNIRVSAADGSEQSSFNGQDSWWDLGLGADFSLGKDTYLYCDFERTLGGNYDRTWQANVGLRYAF